jgi:hypothetical protein
MRIYAGRAAAAIAAALLYVAAGAQPVADVPNRHWAHRAVSDVLKMAVMDAPGRKFAGDRTVTRDELIVTLARLGRVLLQGRWRSAAAAPTRSRQPASWRSRPIDRYQLAAAIDKVASYAARGLPRPAAAPFGKSAALPDRPDISQVRAGSRVKASLAYLAANRMVWPGSVLLKPGPQPITAGQAAEALAQMVAGVNDMLTDEPQNREEIIRPSPRRK